MYNNELERLRAENEKLQQKIDELTKSYKNLKAKGDKVVEKLKHFQPLAYTDALTKVFNRHYLNEVIIPSSTGKEFYMGIADVNDLKQINSNQGYLAGDKEICELADFLADMGTVVRMGGDEFMVISDSPISYNGRFTGYCIASMLKPKNMELMTAFDMLDRQMYTFKKEKNQC